MNAPQPLFYPHPQLQQEEEINIKELVFKYILNYWYLYIIFACLSLLSAYYYIKYTNPVYEVKSRLLIKEDNEKTSSPDDLLKGLKLFGASDNVLNEMHILSSANLMEKVVSQLNLDVTYHWKNWLQTIPSYNDFPIVIDSSSLSPLVTSSDDYRIENGFTLQIKPKDAVRFSLLHNDETLGDFHFGDIAATKYGVFQFNLLDEIDISHDSSMYINFKDPNLVTELYLENIKINLVDEDASVIELTLEENSPQKAIDVLKNLVEIYNEAAIDDKNKVSTNTLNFIDDRLIGITKDLTDVESSVERYKRINEISSTSEKDLEIILQEVSKYTESQTELEVQLNILKSMEEYLKTSGSFDLIPANLSVSNLALKDLIGPYNELVMKRQSLLETATSSNPLVQASEQQLYNLKTTIQSTIRNIKKDFLKKLESVADLNKNLIGKIKNVPTQERGLLEIKRQQVIKENLYLYLLKKKEETAMALAATTSNARVIDTPRASRIPVNPKKKIIYLGSLMAGLFLPFLLIVGKSVFQDTIQNEEDIRTITKTPLIGTINKAKTKEAIVVKKYSRTAIAEQFRLIRTNLQFTKKNGAQTILLTSSISGEGKTFIALNLAMSFALTKQRTIIVGMDLRKPKLKEYLGEEVQPIGVTDFLVGNKTLNQVIQTSKLNSNLDFIISGAIPYNPNELLLDGQVSELFGKLQQEYNVIIIDSAPVGLVSDAFLLNEFITNSIYVIHANYTKNQMVVNADELFQKNRLRNPSILLNGVKTGGVYGYGKSYGYYEN